MLGTRLFVLMAMVFMHIFDDYCLQSFSLCNLKQKETWDKILSNRLFEEKAKEFYKNDYKVALIMHGMSWSFCITLPVIWSWGMCINIPLFVTWILNGLLHAYIDDIKANKKTINLVTDQLFHMGQILIVFITFCVML